MIQKRIVAKKEMASQDSIMDTFTQTEASIGVSVEDPLVDDTCIEPQLDCMIADGLLCDEENEAILALWRYPRQRSLHEFNFTLKKSSSCDSFTILKHCISVRVPDRSRAKRQSTLREFGFIFKAKRQSTLREFGIIVKRSKKNRTTTTTTTMTLTTTTMTTASTLRRRGRK